VDAQHVHLWQQLRQWQAAGADIGGVTRRDQHLHAERFRHFGNRLADVAVTQDAEFPAGKFTDRIIQHGELRRAPPGTGLQQRFVFPEMLGKSQNQREHHLHD